MPIFRFLTSSAKDLTAEKLNRHRSSMSFSPPPRRRCGRRKKKCFLLRPGIATNLYSSATSPSQLANVTRPATNQSSGCNLSTKPLGSARSRSFNPYSLRHNLYSPLILASGNTFRGKYLASIRIALSHGNEKKTQSHVRGIFTLNLLPRLG